MEALGTIEDYPLMDWNTLKNKKVLIKFEKKIGIMPKLISHFVLNLQDWYEYKYNILFGDNFYYPGGIPIEIQWYEVLQSITEIRDEEQIAAFELLYPKGIDNLNLAREITNKHRDLLYSLFELIENDLRTCISDTLTLREFVEDWTSKRHLLSSSIFNVLNKEWSQSGRRPDFEQLVSKFITTYNLGSISEEMIKHYTMQSESLLDTFWERKTKLANRDN